MPTPAEAVRAAIPGIESLDARPKKYSILGFSPKAMIEKAFFQEVEKSELIVTDEQRKSVKVEDGIISSPDFLELKKLLGLPVDHDKMSEQLERALKNRKVIEALNAAIEAAAKQKQRAITPPKALPVSPTPDPDKQGGLDEVLKAVAVACCGKAHLATAEISSPPAQRKKNIEISLG